MAWKYAQNSGVFRDAGDNFVEEGYSGAHPYQNMSVEEHLRDWGPIPAGSYRIGPAFDHIEKGPVVMRLDPIGHSARSRDNFLIHGDNSARNKSA